MLVFGSGISAARRRGEDIRSLCLGIPDLDNVVSSGVADVRTAGHLEEGTSEQDFKGGILDDLNLEEDRDLADGNAKVLDESESHRSGGVSRFHLHGFISGEGNVQLLPDIFPHHNDLSSTIQDRFD
jgi:hypothetical protein